MGELLPILSGLVIGGLLGLLRPSLRLAVGVALAVPFGTLATFLTGESVISWAFALIDIPIVALCSIVGLALARRLRGRAAATQRPAATQRLRRDRGGAR